MQADHRVIMYFQIYIQREKEGEGGHIAFLLPSNCMEYYESRCNEQI